MPDRFIVTGGGGFLGRAIAVALKARGAEVHSLSRGKYPDLEDAGILHHSMDLACPGKSLEELLCGARAVFHTAAKVDMWGRYEDFFACNVLATRNIITACRKTGVERLVFTSSPSVIADGKNLCGVDESYPYPRKYTAFYPMTKAQAEQEVLLAGRRGELKTLALRPHLIWGPGDTNLVPTILDRARAGRLRRIGAGKNRVDLTFIEDCVRAHLLAEEALGRSPELSGQVYFISQGEPVLLWDWVDEVLCLNGLPPLRRGLPVWLAYPLAALLEICSRISPARGEPLLTRFLVSEMATHHYFNISRARRDLDFSPAFSISQALQRTFGAAAI